MKRSSRTACLRVCSSIFRSMESRTATISLCSLKSIGCGTRKVPYQSKQKLTAAGLHYWRRKLRMRWGARQFLLTLALEGGIPVRVVLDGANGWLREYLRAVLRRASSQLPSQEQVIDIAREERWRMSRSYDNDDFVEVCAEFSLAILKLREEAEAGGLSGISNSAILNATHPGWQEELPIHVPAENEDLAKQLLTGLLDEKLSGLATRGIEVRRYLFRRDGEWSPAIQLLADGEIAATRLPGLSTQGRARVVPAGQLAECISGGKFTGTVQLERQIRPGREVP